MSVTVFDSAAQQQTAATAGSNVRTAAFFDLDKTIIAKSSTLAFSKPFFNQGLLNRRAVLKSSYAQFIFLLSGADHDQMDRMRTHIAALGALIDDLFELSRLEAGDITWSLHQVELDELVQETIEAMRVQADAKGVRVTATLPGDLVPARANPEKIQRVLFNLIQNAIRHTPADGSVVVRAEPSAAGVEIEVADTGSGIGPADRARVFTAFYRGGSDAARSGEGAGLGLAVSRAIVEAHGGRIWLADSAAGGGTRVRFSLHAA